MYPLDECRKEITEQIHKILTIYQIPYDVRVETPPGNMGDFAFPCFPLAPLLKKSPADIAQEIAHAITKTHWIALVEAKGGYVNFFIDNSRLTSVILPAILEKRQTYGHLQKKKKKVIIEHTSANPNGPLHVGRARNPIIGDTLVRIYRAAGYDVESQFYLDDMGKQVAILAWGVHHLKQKDIPPSENTKADHLMVGYYQVANERMETDPSVSGQIGDIVKKLERGDQKPLT